LDINKVYTLNEGEDYRDFMDRALEGTSDKEMHQLLIVLLELIITGMKDATYSITLHATTEKIDITITHNGNAIKSTIIDIVDDQVDYLYYRHQSKDCHILKFCKEVNNLHDSR